MRNNFEQVMMDCYRELYANSTPQADFDKLVEDATVNEYGQKEIPFQNYYIDKNVLSTIIGKHKKLVKPKYFQKMFANTILLGCSPMSKD